MEIIDAIKNVNWLINKESPIKKQMNSISILFIIFETKKQKIRPFINL